MKRLIIYIFLLVSILVLIIVNPLKFLSGDRYNLQINDTASVRRIEIKGNENIVLQKNEDGKWMLNEKYDVNRISISNFIYSFQKLSVKGISNKITGAADTLGIRIFSGKKVKDFIYYGRNMLKKEGSEKIFSVEIPGSPKADLSDVFSDDPDTWRDHYVIDLLPDEISEIRVIHPADKDENFMVRMENNAPVLYDSDGVTKIPAEDIDQEKLMMYVTYFMNIFYDHTWVPEDQKTFENPEYIVTVTPRHGKPVTLSVFPLYNNRGEADIFNAVVKYNSDPQPLVMKYIVIDLVLQKKSYFIKK